MVLSWHVYYLTLAVSYCSGSQILMITMGGSRSHKVPFLELGNGLSKRGHNISFISPFPEKVSSPYIQEITPPGLVYYVGNFTDVDLLGSRLRNEYPFSLLQTYEYSLMACDILLSDPETQQLLKSGRHFDLIVLDGAYPDCGYGFAYHYKAPYIYIHTVAFFTDTLSLAGNPAPYSFTPFFTIPFTDNMNIMQRVQNAACHFIISMSHSLNNVFMERILRKQWPNMTSLLTMSRNVSFILQNSHPVISYPRPYLPNVKEIGCIHCKPAKPFPQDLEDFVMASDAGFIYISMGSAVTSAKMPEHLRKLFVNVFAQLPYQVLWKWEAGNGSMSDLPSNVRLSRWLPQQDVLGHSKIRAFISHGGLLSLFETVYHGVPTIAMPVFCDHDSNAMKAEVEGYALRMELQHLTEKSLLEAINKVIHDPRFHENVIKLSSILRDHPTAPLTSAIFWTEYIIRHGGAYHLQSPSKDMNLFQYYSIDVVLIVLAMLVYIIYILMKCIAVFKFVKLVVLKYWHSSKQKQT